VRQPVSKMPSRMWCVSALSNSDFETATPAFFDTHPPGLATALSRAALSEDDRMETDAERGSYLARRFAAGEDGTGEMHVSAASQGFGGRSSAWFDAVRLAEFGEALAGFPLPEEGLTLVSGFGSRTEPGQLEQEHVGLRIYRVHGRGQVGIGVHLAGQRWQGTRPESVPDARFEILTTYQRLRQFSDDFRALAEGGARRGSHRGRAVGLSA
jgi:hypothetical protein